MYSNIVSSLSLARLLTRTVILSVALGMILLMCYTILGSLLSFYIQSKAGIKIPIPKQEWLDQSKRENKQSKARKTKGIPKKEEDQFLED